MPFFFFFGYIKLPTKGHQDSRHLQSRRIILRFSRRGRIILLLRFIRGRRTILDTDGRFNKFNRFNRVFRVTCSVALEDIPNGPGTGAKCNDPIVASNHSLCTCRSSPSEECPSEALVVCLVRPGERRDWSKPSSSAIENHKEMLSIENSTNVDRIAGTEYKKR